MGDELTTEFEVNEAYELVEPFVKLADELGYNDAQCMVIGITIADVAFDSIQRRGTVKMTCNGVNEPYTPLTEEELKAILTRLISGGPEVLGRFMGGLLLNMVTAWPAHRRQRSEDGQ